MNKSISYSSVVGSSLWIQNLVHGLSGLTVKAKHAVFCTSSPFQKIELFDTYNYGLVLCLGGTIVLTERDSDNYHEMMVNPAMMMHSDPKKVCIIGGGDGGCLHQILKHESVESIVIVEIDIKVKETIDSYFPVLSKGFQDRRAKLVIDDGYNFLKSTDSRFDVILVDSYDPGGPVQSLETADFHHVVASRLTDNGIVVFQTDSPTVRADFLRQTLQLISPLFAEHKAYITSMSSFPEGICSFLACAREKGGLENFDEKRYSLIAESCNYYNRDVHKGAFLLPEFIKKRIV